MINMETKMLTNSKLIIDNITMMTLTLRIFLDSFLIKVEMIFLVEEMDGLFNSRPSHLVGIIAQEGQEKGDNLILNNRKVDYGNF